MHFNKVQRSNEHDVKPEKDSSKIAVAISENTKNTDRMVCEKNNYLACDESSVCVQL